MKAVHLLLESELPEDMRNYGRTYNAGAINDILADVGHRYPEHYAPIIDKLARHGREASWRQGETITMNDLRPLIDKAKVFAEMDGEVALAKKESPNREEYRARREAIWKRFSGQLEKDTLKAGVTQGNNVAMSVVSGARGSAAQMKSMLTTPGVYADGQGRTIPMFVRNSHSEGLRPMEFLASTFGARAAVYSTKAGTARGGDLGKQLVQITSPLVVTSRATGHTNGIDLDVEDDSLKYRFMARAAGGWPAGTMIDGRVLASLKKQKVASVLVHSPLTDNSAEGISAESAGARRGGRLPNLGDMVGLVSAHASSEPVTQGSLREKHTAGMTGSKKVFSGLSAIEQFVQSPESFPDRAPVSEISGLVRDIRDAPQGGKIIRVEEEDHYALPGYEVSVKPGQEVEAGDQLADGIVDPRDMVRLRGLGEGRRYYAKRLKQILDDSGVKTDMKHTEMIARGAIDHVRITDPEGLGDYLPDDVVSYNVLAHNYTPPASAKLMKPSSAVGQYLHGPALHYTIGTKLTPRMAKHMETHGFDSVPVSEEAPGFEPEMSRLRTASHNTEDWAQQLTSSYQSKNLLNSATRGLDTNVESNVNFAPRLMIGVGFGKNVRKTGKF